MGANREGGGPGRGAGLIEREGAPGGGGGGTKEAAGLISQSPVGYLDNSIQKGKHQYSDIFAVSHANTKKILHITNAPIGALKCNFPPF